MTSHAREEDKEWTLKYLEKKRSVSNGEHREYYAQEESYYDSYEQLKVSVEIFKFLNKYPEYDFKNLEIIVPKAQKRLIL